MEPKELLKESNIDSSKKLELEFHIKCMVWLLNKAGEVLRNSIIWCDDRAVEIGNLAYSNIGPKKM